MADIFGVLLKWLSTEYGAISALLFLVGVVFMLLYWLERKDRREAWKARNEDLKSTLTILHEHKTLLEVIKEILKGGRL